MLPHIVPVMLDRERHFRLTLGALAALEKKLGRNLRGEGDVEPRNCEEQIVFIWALLLHEDRSLTPEQVGDMVDLPALPGVLRAMAAAMRMPEEAEPADRPTPPANEPPAA